MTDKSELAKWWDNTHEGQDIMWTTDTSGEGVWKNLKVKDLIKTSKTVLDIGVGLGRGTKDLYNEGLEVHGLDISIVALNKVKPFTKNQYLPTDELPKNYFDLAISHLVAQHMCDEDLLEQMKKVILSLKPSGIFAMQFASFKDCNYGTLNPNILDFDLKKRQRLGGCVRTPNRTEELVKKAGGKIVWLSEPDIKKSMTQVFINGAWKDSGITCSCDWYIVHIKKGDTN